MKYKVLVMSPLHQTGATTVSAILAQSLTYANKSVTLAYTDNRSLLPQYLGVKNAQDPTRSITQVAKLIMNHALEDKEILDYTLPMSKHARLLNFSDPALTERDAATIINHVYSRVPTDICIVDNSHDIDSDVTKNLLELSDLVFIVVTPSQKDFARMKYWMEFKRLNSHPNVCVIINMYDETVDALRNMARYIGMPANRVCKLHDNPWLRKCAFTGTLTSVVPKVKGLDPRVANLNCDIDELCQCVISFSVTQSRGSSEDFF